MGPDDRGHRHYVCYAIPSLARLLGTSGFEVVATTKAIWRAKLARKSPGHLLWEVGRFSLSWTWQTLSGLLRIRSEIVSIGRYPSPPGQP